MPRRLVIFTAVIGVAAMISFAVPVHPLWFWPTAAFVALVAALIGGLPFPARGGFACDRCKYNDARYCSNPERPNVTECGEFRAR